MFDLLGFAQTLGPPNRDDVEPDAAIEHFSAGQIPQRRSGDSRLLCVVDAVGWMSGLGRFEGFDLDEDHQRPRPIGAN